MINCLLDNGANVNKLNDEGLSVLAACHVLFYTKHTWKDNIAESVPLENLFNCVQKDQQKGTYIHRNCRQTVSVETIKTETRHEGCEDDKNSEDESSENIENKNKQTHEFCDERTYRIIEFTEKALGRKDNYSDDESENILSEGRNSKMHFSTTGFQQGMLDQGVNLQAFYQGTELQNKQLCLKTFFSGRQLWNSETQSFGGINGDRSGKENIGSTSLFSALSVISGMGQLSDCDDVSSESSMEQNKQVLLAVQRCSIHL